jgi:hypothetical protein
LRRIYMLLSELGAPVTELKEQINSTWGRLWRLRSNTAYSRFGGENRWSGVLERQLCCRKSNGGTQEP